MSWQLTEVGHDGRHEFTVLYHDHSLDIAVADQLIQQGKVLPFHLKILSQVHKLVLAKVYNC
jgi:hypothetical protein